MKVQLNYLQAADSLTLYPSVFSKGEKTENCCIQSKCHSEGFFFSQLCFKPHYACEVSQVVKLCVTVCHLFIVTSRGTRALLEVLVPKAHRCVF